MFKKNFLKTGTLSIVATIVVILVTNLMIIHSCSNEPDVPAPLDIPEEFNEVGKLHNEGLEFVFERIKEQAIESVNNPSVKRLSAKDNDINDFVKQSILDFCKQNEKLQKNMDVCEYVIDRPLSSKISLKSATSEEIEYLDDIEINPALQKLLNEVYAVLSKEFKANEFSQLKTQLDAINKKAAATISETEAAVVYCATSTGYNSYQYWMDNYKKWYFALNFPEILEQYNNADLNQLEVKRGNIVKMGFLDDLWNNVENWWHTNTSAFANWWNTHGITEIVLWDITGAAFGACLGQEVGPWAMLIGAVVVGANGSICAAQTISL